VTLKPLVIVHSPTLHAVISHNAHWLTRSLSNSTVTDGLKYLTSLREFQTKGGNNHQTIRLGDVVIVQDDFKPRLQWTLAVVDELLTGNDGLTRAARIRTSGGITTRPIVKLYPLEVQCDDN